MLRKNSSLKTLTVFVSLITNLPLLSVEKIGQSEELKEKYNNSFLVEDSEGSCCSYHEKNIKGWDDAFSTLSRDFMKIMHSDGNNWELELFRPIFIYGLANYWVHFWSGYSPGSLERLYEYSKEKDYDVPINGNQKDWDNFFKLPANKLAERDLKAIAVGVNGFFSNSSLEKYNRKSYSTEGFFINAPTNMSKTTIVYYMQNFMQYVYQDEKLCNLGCAYQKLKIIEEKIDGLKIKDLGIKSVIGTLCDKAQEEISISILKKVNILKEAYEKKYDIKYLDNIKKEDQTSLINVLSECTSILNEYNFSNERNLSKKDQEDLKKLQACSESSRKKSFYEMVLLKEDFSIC